jgi:LPXTG-motif cell wall-anchored protein
MLEVDPIYVASSISFLDSVTGEPLPEVQRQLESAPVPVRVRELPAENRPAGFSGATGKFTVSARLLHDNLRQQEAGRLLVTVGGAGNFLQLQPPEVPWPAGVEAFPPAITDRLKRNTVPVTGQRTFTFSFVADRPGAYAIPPVRLSFFDPETAAYQTLQTDTLRFQVRAGGVPAPASGKGRTGGSGPAGWLIALGLLVLLGVVVWLLRSRKKRPAPAPVVNTEPQTDYPAAIRALSAAGGAQTAAALEALLHRYARARWRLQGNGPLAAQLAQAGVPEGEVQEWKAVLEGCQRMAYGDGGVDLEALKERAVRLVSGA